MNKMLTLTRDGRTIKALARQMPHDEQAVVGRKFHHGTGKMWIVMAVENAPEYNPA